MKFINETCYSTEDLESLFAKILGTFKLCNDRHAKNEPGRLQRKRTLPNSMRVGYYQPSGSKYVRNTFVNMTGYNENIRLGIVKRSKLGIIPLVALAQAADGADLSLPPGVVREIVHSLVGQFTPFWKFTPARELKSDGRWRADDYDDLWTWIESFKVSYTMRAKRGSKAKVKRARELSKLANLKASLIHKAEAIKHAKNQVIYTERVFEQSEHQISELTKKLGLK